MSPLRVIGGSAKGRKLHLVPGDKTRPILDRVKESFFNIIREDLPESRFLDMFAGTGSVGIEALSRGASQVVFVDNHRAAIQTLEKNLASTGLKEKAIVRLGDSLAYVSGSQAKNFDYVFIAPPQYKQMWERALLKIDGNPGLLVEDAWVVAQIDKREYRELFLENVEEFDQRKYGNTLLVFYERKPIE